MNAPAEYWGESIVNSLFILGFFRLLVTTHITWLVNSAMLIWGMESGSKLLSIFTTIRLLIMLFYNMPKSHGTVMINDKGIHVS